jgi:hypothetical protein
MSIICVSTLKITGSFKHLQRFKETVCTKTTPLEFRAFVEEPEPWMSELVSDQPEQLIYKFEGSSTPGPFLIYASFEFPKLTFECHCDIHGSDIKEMQIWVKDGEINEREC